MRFLKKAASKAGNLAKTAFGRLARKLSSRSSKSSAAATPQQENLEGASEDSSDQSMPKRDGAEGQPSLDDKEKPASKDSQAPQPPRRERQDSAISLPESPKKASSSLPPDSDAEYAAHIAALPDTRHKSIIDFEASGMRGLMNTLSPEMSAADYDNALQKLDKHLTAMKPTDEGVEYIKSDVCQKIVNSGKGFDIGSKAHQMLVKWMNLDTETVWGRASLRSLADDSKSPCLTPDQTYTLMDLVAEKVAIRNADPDAEGRMLVADVRDRVLKEHPGIHPGMLDLFNGACHIASVPPSHGLDCRKEAFDLILTLQYPDFAQQHRTQILDAIKERLEVTGNDENTKMQPMAINGFPVNSHLLRTLVSNGRGDPAFSAKEEEIFKLWDEKANPRMMLSVGVQDGGVKDNPGINLGAPPSDGLQSRTEALKLILGFQDPDFVAQNGNQIMDAIKGRLDVAGKDKKAKALPLAIGGFPANSNLLRTLVSYGRPDPAFSAKEEEIFKLWDQKLFGINS